MKGKAGPKPGPVKSAEDKAAEKAAKTEAARTAAEAKAKEKAEAKAAKEKAAADAKTAKETEAAGKAAAKAAEKAAKAAAKTPGVGHNSGLTEEQQRALFVQNLTKIEELKEAAASAAGRLRAQFKVAKSDGFSKKDIEYAIALRKDREDGKDEMADGRRREQMIARWVNHPIGTQPDLFDSVDRTPAVDNAFEEGKLAGMEGKPCSPPHHLATEQAQKWIEAWHQGQALLVRENISPIVKKAEPAQEAFDDVLDGAPKVDDFESATPDHAKDPTSPANPANSEVRH